MLTPTRPGQATATAALQLYPQPAAPGSAVQLALERPVTGPIQAQLFDPLGRAVTVTATGSGQHWQLTLPTGLAPGLYALRLRPGNATAPLPSAKLLVRDN